MNFLKSRWTAAIIAVILNVLMSGGLIFFQRDSLQPAAPVAKVNEPPPFWSFSGVEVDKMVLELQNQRKRLETRESDLEKVAAQLSAERDELKAMRNEIEATRNELTTAIVEVQESEIKNVRSLALTYSSMSASAAVPILSELDDKIIVKILAQMKADKSGAIFQEMARVQSPDGEMVKRAAHLSDLLRLMKVNKSGAQKL